MKESPIVFVNIPWMRHYKGANEEDMPLSSHGYTKEFASNDHTQLQFQGYKNKYYGHVPGGTSPNLKKLGGNGNEKFLDNITVVWIATDPDAGGHVIVGWYEKARIWAKRQRPTGQFAKTHVTAEGNEIGYSIEAAIKDSKLIEPGNRPLLPGIGKSRGRPGRSPFWYATDKPRTKDLVRKMIKKGDLSKASLTKKSLKVHSGGWLQDTKERQEIEWAAMDFIMAHYIKNGYKVEDVSADKVGYDVLAFSSSKAKLYLEVKGSKGPFLNIELTPNEYSFAKKNHPSFRLCVVLNSLSKKPVMRIFRTVPRGQEWRETSGKVIQTSEKIGAIIRE